MATDTIKGVNESGLSLPGYVVLRPEGVFINLSPPPQQDILQLFVDRLFGNGARFSVLNYAYFMTLLYGAGPAEFLEKNISEIKIADSIVRFPQDRVDLYRDPKIDMSGKKAEYLFERVYVDVVKEEPIYGDPDENGVMPIVDYERHTEEVPVELNFDEFVAAMWLKGVRFGIDAGLVRQAMEKGDTVRLAFAVEREPAESRDAQVVEESDHLRQDNAPMILPNGKADLRRARNRFPQVARNTPLLRKIPRELGKPGWAVTGTVIEARKPDDIDFNRLAGDGTRIEKTPNGEILMAAIDGFLMLDEQTGAIAITDKIENKAGISAKSTGDVLLAVDNYVEHGEVQEGRVVEGKHMTFRSNVFGAVIAKDGNIDIHGNLSGGRAQSLGGDVAVKGRVINATLEAWDGSIVLDFAESCMILGKVVTIAHAVNCEIVAEELHLGKVEGCEIGGRSIEVGSSTVRRGGETIIAVLLPDIPAIDRQIAEAKAGLTQIEHAIQAKNREIAATQNDPGFTRYVAIAEKVRAGQIKFTPEQQVEWQKIVNQFAPVVKGTEGLMKRHLALEEAIRRWTGERKECGNGINCKIGKVEGETVVRKLASNLGMLFFRNMPQDALKAELRQLGEAQNRIFSSEHGSFEWAFKVPEPAA
jgi:hypothetical protein